MFHENLKILRKEKGFSQEQLAFRLNVVRQTVSKWEKGLSVPDAELLIRLADVLEVSVSDLLGTKIEVPAGEDKEAVLAKELAKLNEILVTYGAKLSKLKKVIGIALALILVVVFFCAIYDSWTDMWYEFGYELKIENNTNNIITIAIDDVAIMDTACPPLFNIDHIDAGKTAYFTIGWDKETLERSHVPYINNIEFIDFYSNASPICHKKQKCNQRPCAVDCDCISRDKFDQDTSC